MVRRRVRERVLQYAAVFVCGLTLTSCAVPSDVSSDSSSTAQKFDRCEPMQRVVRRVHGKTFANNLEVFRALSDGTSIDPPLIGRATLVHQSFSTQAARVSPMTPRVIGFNAGRKEDAPLELLFATTWQSAQVGCQSDAIEVIAVCNSANDQRTQPDYRYAVISKRPGSDEHSVVDASDSRCTRCHDGPIISAYDTWETWYGSYNRELLEMEYADTTREPRVAHFVSIESSALERVLLSAGGPSGWAAWFAEMTARLDGSLEAVRSGPDAQRALYLNNENLSDRVLRLTARAVADTVRGIPKPDGVQWVSLGQDLGYLPRPDEQYFTDLSALLKVNRVWLQRFHLRWRRYLAEVTTTRARIFQSGQDQLADAIGVERVELPPFLEQGRELSAYAAFPLVAALALWSEEDARLDPRADPTDEAIERSFVRAIERVRHWSATRFPEAVLKNTPLDVGTGAPESQPAKSKELTTLFNFGDNDFKMFVRAVSLVD